MTIRVLLVESALDPAVVELLAEAFDTAWAAVEKSGSPVAAPAQAPATREKMARRIIELGRRGERSLQRLVDEALATVTPRD